MSALLIDEDTSQQFVVPEPACKIGSGPNNGVVLTGEGVSPVHVRIEKRGEDYYAALEPGGLATKKVMFFLDMPNCTLNRKPLEAKLTKLASGDKLQIGSRLLRFYIT